MTSGSPKGDGASPSRAKEHSVKVVLRDGWDRILEGEGLAGTFLSLFLLICLAVGSAVLLVPRAHQVIPYDERDLHEFASFTLKAHRSYRIEDRAATERKRQEAREEILAVYDYEIDAADQIVRRVQEAFGLMQRAWRDRQAQVAAAVEAAEEARDVAVVEDDEVAEDEVRSPPRSPEAVADQPPEQVSAVFLAHKDAFLQQLQLPLDDAAFDTLVEERFSPEIERAVIRLVREGMERPIIADRQLIAADRMRGLTLRPVPVRDARRERVVRDVDGQIRDLAMARAALNERLAEVLPEAEANVRAVSGRLARRLLRPTLTFNRDETERRRDSAAQNVRATFIELEAGEKIIGDGERIEPRHLVIFQGIREQAAATSTPNTYVGSGLFAVLMALALFSFARGGVWRFKPSRKDLLFMLMTLLGTLLGVRGGMFLADALADRWADVPGSLIYYAVPAGAAVVLVRLVLSGEATLIFALVLSAMVGLLADHSLGYALFTLIGGLVAAERVSRARDRSGIWQAGTLMASVNVLIVIAIGLHEAKSLSDLYPGMVAAAIAGAVTPLIVLGLAILVENVFRYTTDLKLLELANLNNPLLKDLVVAAPGTYHHSMMIGTMVEAAAEAIGANPLLARVGAYYHDIGKGKNPLYFAENQKGENPHDKLTPSMSALIIRRHVTDGVKMARTAGLPAPIIDMIPMHHGTRLMAYFWHKAKEEAEKKNEPPPSETEYRHGGPKPRFREAALLMIADSVEAASRTLVEPTTDRLRGLVQKVINACFADGQFDECDITLKDLHAITRSFVTSLEAIYHSRPEYQQPADKSSERPAGKNGEKAKAPKADEKVAKANGETAQDGGSGGRPAPQPEVDAVAATQDDTPVEDDGTGKTEDGKEPQSGEVLKRLGMG